MRWILSLLAACVPGECRGGRLSWRRRCALAATAMAGATLMMTVAARPAPQSPTSPVPERFFALFHVLNNGSHVGEARWTLEPVDGGRFELRSVTEARGLWSLLLAGERVERSLWTWRDGRPAPLEYRYTWTGRKARDVKVVFDWEEGVVHNVHGEDRWTLEVEPGTQDKFLYLLELMHDLARGAADLRYTIADGGKLKEYAAVRLGRESLETPLGPLETVKLRRSDPRGKRTTTLWMAPKLGYFPVRVEHAEKDGDVATMTIERLERSPA